VSLRLDTVAIAQPSALGDVVACLPMAAAIKLQRPSAKIILIGRGHARSLAEACGLIDHFVEAGAVVAQPQLLNRLGVDAFLAPYLPFTLGMAARHARIPLRVGNLRRPKSLLWANRFIVQGSRLVQRHRALLNLAYLRPLGLHTGYSMSQLAAMPEFDRRLPLPPGLRALLEPARFNLVLHPKSNGSAREWPLRHFCRLLELLPPERVKIFVTGVAGERERLLAEGMLLSLPGVVDLTGKLDLAELVSFLGAVDGFVGASTGPLHIAAAVGIHSLGLFPGRDRATAVRWHPLGRRAQALWSRQQCKPGPGRCPADYRGEFCPCMEDIAPEQVARRVMSWINLDGASAAADAPGPAL
jgi:heptosyltransferase-3